MPDPDAIARVARAPSSHPKAVEEPALARPDPGQSGAYRPVVYEPSKGWLALYRRFFSHVQRDPGWAPGVRAAAAKGQVVYIGRSVSFLDFLTLDFVTKEHGLPLARFANDLGMWLFEPFGRGSRRARLKAPIPEDQGLTECILSGHSAMLFLRRPPHVLAAPSAGGARHGEALEVDLIRTLVELQRKIQRPLLLLPQTIVWTKRPPNSRKGLVDLLFGPSEWPGRIRTFLQFLFNFRNALLRSGEPFDLAEFLEEHQDLTDAEAADRVRYALLRRVERERTLVLGPAKKTATRIREELLRSPRVARHIMDAARDSRREVEVVRREANRELEQLCASVDMTVVDLFHRVIDRVWNRIYDGLVVDEEGVARIREAARKGPLILVPSHKSHVDYLVLSDVLYARGMAPPLIAAGDNLSFFPLGALLRRSGAFFIKRSFKGNRLYPQLVDAYIRKVLVEGWNLELFVEGGRSRTGKLLPPKLGILSMIVDAALKLDDREIQFVPISIGYERIIEEGSYVAELEGGEKQKESVGGILESRKILRSKYGQLFIQVGEIMSFAALRREAAGLDAEDGVRAEGELTPPQRRALVQRVAHRITYEINRVTLVTPAALTASALMSHRRRGVSRSELEARAAELLRAFRRHGAPVAKTLHDRAGELRPDALESAIKLFLDAKLVTVTNEKEALRSPKVERIYMVPEERRIALEYHKNTVLHFFVPSALVASSLAALGWETPLSALRDRVRALSKLFKLEFMFRADAEFEEIFSDALSKMIEGDEVLWEGDRVRRAGGDPGRRLVVYSDMIRTYFESYLLALRAVKSLTDKKVLKKDWVKATLALGRRELASGEITRRESVARAKFETALPALHELGFARTEGDYVKAGAKLADARAVAELEGLLESHLRAE